MKTVKKSIGKARKAITALVNKANKTKPVRNHINTKIVSGNWHWENNVELSNGKYTPLKCMFTKKEITSWHTKWANLKGYANYRKFKEEVGGFIALRAKLDNQSVDNGTIHSAQYDYCCTRGAEIAKCPQFTHLNKGWNFKDGRNHKASEAQKKCA